MPRSASIRRASLFAQEEPNILATLGNGALMSLIRNRSSISLASRRGSTSNLGQDDDEGDGGSMPLRLRDEDDEPRRSAAEERRLSQILMGPQMRSMRLIGSSNPRYMWERYWKGEDELKTMRKPL
jgi:hypothetical protein